MVYPTNLSPQLKSLLEGLFKKSQAERLGCEGIDEIKKHSWFARTNWVVLKKKLMKAPFRALLLNKQTPDREDNIEAKTDKV